MGKPFLYSYEEEYISSLISSDKIKAKHFHSAKSLIDDPCAINDGEELFIYLYHVSEGAWT